MAYSNKEDYEEKDVMLARFARALGHPARIAIMRHLASLNCCCFNEISKEMPIADSTVSQHMKELKEAGLIQGSIEPPRIKYCINRGNWALAQELMNEFMNQKLFKLKKIEV